MVNNTAPKSVTYRFLALVPAAEKLVEADFISEDRRGREHHDAFMERRILTNAVASLGSVCDTIADMFTGADGKCHYEGIQTVQMLSTYELLLDEPRASNMRNIVVQYVRTAKELRENFGWGTSPRRYVIQHKSNPCAYFQNKMYRYTEPVERATVFFSLAEVDAVLDCNGIPHSSVNVVSSPLPEPDPQAWAVPMLNYWASEAGSKNMIDYYATLKVAAEHEQMPMMEPDAHSLSTEIEAQTKENNKIFRAAIAKWPVPWARGQI